MESDFYKNFENAQVYSLIFPADQDGIGPYWDESGNLARETLIYSPAAYMHMGEFGLYRA